MKIFMQIFIVILTVFAYLPLFELCILAIKTAIEVQDFLAVVILLVEAMLIIILAVITIYIDIKGEDL